MATCGPAKRAGSCVSVHRLTGLFLLVQKAAIAEARWWLGLAEGASPAEVWKHLLMRVEGLHRGPQDSLEVLALQGGLMVFLFTAHKSKPELVEMVGGKLYETFRAGSERYLVPVSGSGSSDAGEGESASVSDLASGADSDISSANPSLSGSGSDSEDVVERAMRKVYSMQEIKESLCAAFRS